MAEPVIGIIGGSGVYQIEGLEEAVDLGGGHVLIFGCAAGDVGIAAILKVS